MKFLIEIQGGIGPDVWDKELEIGAADIQDALNIAKEISEELRGNVVLIQQVG